MNAENEGFIKITLWSFKGFLAIDETLNFEVLHSSRNAIASSCVLKRLLNSSIYYLNPAAGSCKEARIYRESDDDGCPKIHTIGTHVGNTTCLVQSLGNHHRLTYGKSKLS